MSGFDRRRFLKLGTAAATTALAGCFGGETTDPPTYTDWIPPADDRILVAYIDFRISEKAPEADQLLPLILPSRGEDGPTDLVPDFSGLDSIGDPFLQWPLDVGSRLLAGAGIGFAAGGLGYLVDPDRPADMVDELFIANGVVVGTGDFDTDRADENLRAGTDDFLGEVSFEPAGEHGEFTLYEPTTDAMDGITAVSETAVVVADTRDEVRTAVDAWRGDTDRAVGDSGTFGWLIDTAGSGDFVAGWEGPVDPDAYTFGEREDPVADGLLSDRKHVVASISFSPDDDEITADLAVEDAGLDGETWDRLESRLGTATDELSVSTDDDRLSASATYAADVLDVEFTEPEEQNDDGGPDESTPTEGDLPSEVANAVPDGALRLSYEEDQRRVKVTFEKENDADEVTMRAVESEYEVSTSTPDPGTYFYVYVDPDGDEVVVTATVDGVTGELARREFP